MNSTHLSNKGLATVRVVRAARKSRLTVTLAGPLRANATNPIASEARTGRAVNHSNWRLTATTFSQEAKEMIGFAEKVVMHVGRWRRPQ